MSFGALSKTKLRETFNPSGSESDDNDDWLVVGSRKRKLESPNFVTRPRANDSPYFGSIFSEDRTPDSSPVIRKRTRRPIRTEYKLHPDIEQTEMSGDIDSTPVRANVDFTTSTAPSTPMKCPKTPENIFNREDWEPITPGKE